MKITSKIAICDRYKDNVPFSDRLNSFIAKKVKNIPFEVTDSDNYDTYEKIRNYYKETGKIIVWSGGGSHIYGENKYNILQRVWHDYTHIVNNLNFDPINEIKVSEIQVSELPFKWSFERMILSADIAGQVLYFTENGRFPDNQRSFVLSYIIDPITTLKSYF